MCDKSLYVKCLMFTMTKTELKLIMFNGITTLGRDINNKKYEANL